MTPAVKAAALRLQHFTCAAMAKDVGARDASVQKILMAMVEEGELVREGNFYDYRVRE
jgi:hypothetical protein